MDMNDGYYRLPKNLAEDIDAYEQAVQTFLAGDLSPDVMRAKRVPRGVYEQRQDGVYMLRVRIAGGTFSLDQGRELADLAREYGNGLLHPTTRQDIQLHELDIGDTPVVMRRLYRVGLTSKGGGGNTVRNVTACPYAGICPHECFDVTPAAQAVTEHLIALDGSYNLPRKYKIAFSGCSSDCALGQVADLGFIAKKKDGQPGFTLYAGGGLGASSRVGDLLEEWTPASDVLRVAETVRRLFDRLGDRGNRNRARLRYVFERIGKREFRKQFRQELQQLSDSAAPVWSGELNLSEEQEGSSGLPHIRYSEGGLRYVEQRQKGQCAVPLELPLGFVSADDFEEICVLASKFSGKGGLRTTRAQNLLIRFVDEKDLFDLQAALSRLELNPVKPGAIGQFVSCAGAATCRLGLCLARGAARAAADKLDSAEIGPDALDEFRVYINGCPNACGHQPVGPIGFYGVAQRVEGRLMPAYRVTVGGRCDAKGARLGSYAGQIPAKAMPNLLVELADDFEKRRQQGESLDVYIDRQGGERFREIIAGHSEAPAYDDDPDCYRDFGADEDFSLAGRGAGECGAGVFEIIRRDLSEARKASEPFAILLPTARALLITRGVDARDGDMVFREFERHFIDTVLVSEDFRDLLARARGYLQGWQAALDGYEDSVARLVERVELLYSSLDASLQFHPPEAEESSRDGAGEGTPDNTPSEDVVEVDLSGVPCPLNFVQAKLHLEDLEIGRRLAIVLDDGEPVENVPESFKGEGQTIEEIRDLGDGHWRVVVRKGK